MIKKMILAIDDDRVILLALQTILEEVGFWVMTAKNGVDGFTIIKARSPDIIILDINMPSMDGLEFLEQLNSDAVTRNIPVLMLTGQNNMTDVSACKELGASDYIVKPFQHNELLERIRQLASWA